MLPFKEHLLICIYFFVYSSAQKPDTNHKHERSLNEDCNSKCMWNDRKQLLVLLCTANLTFKSSDQQTRLLVVSVFCANNGKPSVS